MRIAYVGLEPYQSRYTLQLTEWNFAEFRRLGVDFVNVPGKTIDDTGKINLGDVLDVHGRPYFALSQMMSIIEMMRDGRINNNTVIFFEDMFHPGIEALPYIFSAMPNGKPKVAVRCLAQTIDPDDFVHRRFMAGWMRKFEEMSLEFIDILLFASEEFLGYFKTSGMWEKFNGDVHVTGLPFGKAEVISRVPNIKPFGSRKDAVAFSSRFDSEKQPHFFMDVVEKCFDDLGLFGFKILSGTELKSDDPTAITRAFKLQEQGKLTIYENLTKNDYYEHLNNTRVLFNCALQDWVSNTVSEADALECNVVFPAYRSFPEVFANDYERLYIPWSVEDASHKIAANLYLKSRNVGLISDYQDGTIERTVNAITGHINMIETERTVYDYRNGMYLPKYNLR